MDASVIGLTGLFAVQSHPKPPSMPEASSHSYPYPEARVPAKRLRSNDGHQQVVRIHLHKRNRNVSPISHNFPLLMIRN